MSKKCSFCNTYYYQKYVLNTCSCNNQIACVNCLHNGILCNQCNTQTKLGGNIFYKYYIRFLCNINIKLICCICLILLFLITNISNNILLLLGKGNENFISYNSLFGLFFLIIIFTRIFAENYIKLFILVIITWITDIITIISVNINKRFYSNWFINMINIVYLTRLIFSVSVSTTYTIRYLIKKSINITQNVIP